jgi:hypothetical protein
MAWAKRYAMRNTVSSVSRTSALYGAGTYGGDFTYGQEATDSLANVEYVLAAKPGEWPSTAGWVYRTGASDVSFTAVVLGIDGPLDLSPVAAAVLVIERAGVGPETFAAYELSVNGDNTLSYTFGLDELPGQGIYRAAVQLEFDSGRCMTVTPDDAASLIVRGVD